jgi:hypothetical protein
MIINVMVKIVPVGDAIHSSVSAGDQAWGKKYSSMEVAATEAEELGMIPSGMKQLLCGAQRMPSYPHGFESEADVDLEELITRGFLPVGCEP